MKINQTLLGVALVVVIIAGGLSVATMTGMVSLQAAPGGGTTIITGGGGQQQTGGPDLTFCQGLNQVALYASEKNGANTTQNFLAAAFRAANSVNPDSTIATATGTAGTSETLTTVSIPCGTENAKGKIYSVADASNNGGVIGAYDIASGNRVVKGTSSAGGQVRLTLRDINNANLSLVDQTAATEAAVALSAGQSRSFFIDVNGPSVSGTQAGSDLGQWVFIDYVRPIAVQSVAISGPGLVEITNCDAANLASAASQLGITLPTDLTNTFAKAVQVESADRCYWMTKQGSGDALRRFGGTLVAGATDPTTTDDPVIYYDDVQVLEYQGKLYWGSVNTAGTDVGQTVSTVTINLS